MDLTECHAHTHRVTKSTHLYTTMKRNDIGSKQLYGISSEKKTIWLPLCLSNNHTCGRCVICVGVDILQTCYLC